MRRLLPFLLLPVSLFAQGYSVENFSGGTNGTAPTTTTLSAGWFGFRGSGPDVGTGCTMGTAACDTGVSNSSGAMTYSNTSPCGAFPPNSGGPNALAIDYNTTLGNGVSNQWVKMNFPVAQSNPIEAVTWFCSDIPVTANFGTTFDGFIIIGGTSHISNYICNGSDCGITLESSGGQTAIKYVPGTWVQQTVQYVNGGACADVTGHTDCVRLRLYDNKGQQITACMGGGTGCGEVFTSNSSANAAYITLGNLNSATLPAGHHVQFMNVKVCNIGCTASQFPLLETPVPAWDGIITPGRAPLSWTNAGFNGGVLPDAAWTQCGTTLAAGTYAGSTITTSLAGCTANTYYLLGPGTFNISGQIKFPTSGHVVLRGSGSNSTFLVHSGTGSTTCAQASTMICMLSSDTTFTTQPPPNTCTVSSGLTQGSTSITVANLAGTCPTGINTTDPTLIFLDACDTGLSGATCGTGSSTDNSQYFVCGNAYNATGPTGCSIDGPDSGGSRSLRNQLEIHTATANASGVLTITPPILASNWGALSNPQVWTAKPIVRVGVENLAMDGNAAGSPAQGIETQNGYQVWISGVKLTNWTRASINLFQATNSIVQSNYVYNCRGTAPSCYGIRQTASANNLITNNILQQVLSPIFDDGASSGHVIAYNFIIDDKNPSNTLSPAITEHAGNYFDLFEGNAVNQIACDDIHGTCDMVTLYRNFLPGWESIPSAPVATFTNGIANFTHARYTNNVANVLGTLGYHASYSAASANTAIYWMGGGLGGVPTDALTASTTLRWASYDINSAANRFCGNSLDTGWGTTCASTSEAPASASTFPNAVPVVGDTAINEPTLPASFYYLSAPTWWPNTIPFPAIGPDISSGNVGQCTGTINTPGQFAKVAAIAAGQCTGTTLTTGWAGHVNAIPAMNCALSIMGMPPDGSGSVLSFDPVACGYTGVPPAPIATFSPSSVNIGQVPQNMTSNPSPVVTLTNTGTANLVNTNIAMTNSLFTIVNNTCGTPATITNSTGTTSGFTLAPGASCTFQFTFSPTGLGPFNGGAEFFENTATSPDTPSFSGTSTGPPAPSTVQSARNIQ